MKVFAKQIIGMVNKLWLLFFSIGVAARGNRFFLSGIECPRNNVLSLTGSDFQRTKIVVEGEANVLAITGANISRANILMRGTRNQLKIEQGVRLDDVRIIIRGSGCSISIGKNTTSGGGRIVTVGHGLPISIGEECMFSDQIEIWASDTHPIYGQAGEIMNECGAVAIGNGVWLGSRVVVLKGVSIGSGSVVGMGTIVTSDIPENSVSVGHPNKTVWSNIRWSRHWPDEQDQVQHNS